MVPFVSRRIALFLCSSMALAMFMVDHTTSWLDPVRSGFNRILSPVYNIAGITRHATDQSGYWFETKDQLVQRIIELESEKTAREFTLQRYAQVKIENQSLRDLLKMNTDQPVHLFAAQALVQQINTAQQKIVIDKGIADGITENAVVLDSKGIMGQVHFVSEHHAWVTLITDPQHSIPVLVGEDKVWGVLRGMGEIDLLEVSYVPETADIRVGDVIVSAGTGGRFPKGYPVAQVSRIEPVENSAFAHFQATPVSLLSQIRFVLVMNPVNSDALIDQDEVKKVDDDVMPEEED